MLTIQDGKEKLGEIIDGIDNTLFMAEGPTSKLIPIETHLKGCITQLKEIKGLLEEVIDK